MRANRPGDSPHRGTCKRPKVKAAPQKETFSAILAHSQRPPHLGTNLELGTQEGHGMNVAYPGPWAQISEADALLMDVARRIQLSKTKHETAETNFRALC